MIKSIRGLAMLLVLFPFVAFGAISLSHDKDGNAVVVHYMTGPHTVPQGILVGNLSDPAPSSTCDAAWAWGSSTTWTAGGLRYWQLAVNVNSNLSPRSTECRFYANAGELMQTHPVSIVP